MPHNPHGSPAKTDINKIELIDIKERDPVIHFWGGCVSLRQRETEKGSSGSIEGERPAFHPPIAAY